MNLPFSFLTIKSSTFRELCAYRNVDVVGKGGIEADGNGGGGEFLAGGEEEGGVVGWDAGGGRRRRRKEVVVGEIKQVVDSK